MPNKKSKNTSSKRLLKKNVVVIKKVRKITTKPKKAQIPRPMTDSRELTQYASALSDPFADRSIGARVPDMFSAPTVTYHARGTMTIASSSSGVASLLLTPLPHLSTIDINTTAVNSSGQQGYFYNTSAYQAVTAANLSTNFSSYRVVGAGWKIRNLLPPTSATGRIIIAPAACAGSVPGPAFLNQTAVQNSKLSLDLIGVTTVTDGYSSDILESPGAAEYTIQDIITNSVTIVSKPLTPQAFSLVNTYTSSLTGNSIYETGDAFVTVATGLVTSGENANDRVYGWEAFMLRAEGLPPSTTNCFEIQYVLHLEGIPAQVSGAGQMIPAATPVAHVNINGHNAVLSKMLSKPSIKFASDLAISGARGYASGGSSGAGLNVLSTLFAKLGMQL
jgi:hypothetical protein